MSGGEHYVSYLPKKAGPITIMILHENDSVPGSVFKLVAQDGKELSQRSVYVCGYHFL